MVPAQDSEAIDTLEPRAQAAGADVATALLAQRFALPGSKGISELCYEVTSLQAFVHPADAQV